ncbi:hypothetical protein KM043_012117 [Ampulex compressa]|nr:hypothetical protein KM043_012117 [Ampulex compressa]
MDTRMDWLVNDRARRFESVLLAHLRVFRRLGAGWGHASRRGGPRRDPLKGLAPPVTSRVANLLGGGRRRLTLRPRSSATGLFTLGGGWKRCEGRTRKTPKEKGAGKRMPARLRLPLSQHLPPPTPLLLLLHLSLSSVCPAGGYLLLSVSALASSTG